MTETALRGIEHEAQKAAVSLETALSICCARGWTGFKAEWLTNQDSPKYQPAQLSAARAIFGDERGAYAALT